MQFLIDHLIAVVVGSVLLGGLLVLQLRGNDAAVAATAQYRSQAMTAGFATTLEREVENMRSRTETEYAFGASALPSLGTGEAYRFRLRTADDGEGDVYTRLFSFPTLGDPDELGDSPIIIVSYLVEPTGDSTFVDGRDRALYQITRHEFARGGPVVWTDVVDGVVDFDVTMFPADGSPARQNLNADMATAETPPRVQIEIRTAHSFGVSRRGQMATSTRHARSIRIPAASAKARETVPDPATAGGIPLFPGDPGAGPAVAESAAPGTSGGTDTPGNSGNGNGNAGNGNAGNGNAGNGNSGNGNGNSGGDTGNSGNSGNGNGNSGGDTGNAGNGNSGNGNGNSGNGNGNSGGDTGSSGNGNGNSGGDTGNSGNGNSGNGNSGNGNAGNGNAGNGSPGSEADEIVTVCHVSWLRRRTLRGTRAELDAHFSHYFDYTGTCR